MDNSTLSSWIRQARHRAKNYNIYSDLNIEDVSQMIDKFEKKCAYQCYGCQSEIDTLDHPFPLKDFAPNVQSNILPSCKICKNLKKNNDLVWLFNNNHVSKQRYIEILEILLSCNHADQMREHIRKVTGIIE